MEYRVEKKYLVTEADLAAIAGRLKQVMLQDIHQHGSFYNIRSIYFDDLQNHCAFENEAGLDQREKYRIRIYDGSASLIHLEIKEKIHGFTKKRACSLSQDECSQILDGNLSLSLDERKPLNQLLLHMQCINLRPNVLISYDRTAFTYPAGNVRITFDRNISASRCCEDFLSQNVRQKTAVLPKGIHVLEIKYDEFLPDIIAQLVEDGSLSQTAFSKYYLGRLAVNGEFVY